jgi:hypothetical protein
MSSKEKDKGTEIKDSVVVNVTFRIWRKLTRALGLITTPSVLFQFTDEGFQFGHTTQIWIGYCMFRCGSFVTYDVPKSSHNTVFSVSVANFLNILKCCVENSSSKTPDSVVRLKIDRKHVYLSMETEGKSHSKFSISLEDCTETEIRVPSIETCYSARIRTQSLSASTKTILSLEVQKIGLDVSDASQITLSGKGTKGDMDQFCLPIVPQVPLQLGSQPFEKKEGPLLIYQSKMWIAACAKATTIGSTSDFKMIDNNMGTVLILLHFYFDPDSSTHTDDSNGEHGENGESTTKPKSAASGPSKTRKRKNTAAPLLSSKTPKKDPFTLAAGGAKKQKEKETISMPTPTPSSTSLQPSPSSIAEPSPPLVAASDSVTDLSTCDKVVIGFTNSE